MEKFYGVLGYIKTVEEPPMSGIWVGKTIERNYYGDVIRLSSMNQMNDKANGDISLNSQFSILSDPYSLENFSFLKYVKYMGVLWEIKTVEVQYPRLIITVGGVYNEETAS